MSAPERHRILYLAGDDRHFWQHRGGLARAVRRAGAEVALAAPPGPLRGTLEEAGLHFYPVPLRRGNRNPCREISALREIAVVLRSFRPHLVHQITFKPIVLGSLAARWCGRPARVASVTGLGYVFTGGGIARALLRTVAESGYRMALRGARVRAIFENPDDQALFLRRGLVAPERARLILGAGVDTRRFTPAPEPPKPVTIVLAARLLWDKGVGELIEAARILRAEGADFRVLLAGSPDPANPAAIGEGQLHAWEKQGLARRLGHVEDMPRLLADCHIACLPSYREGLPVSLMEAAASGLPIVTTDAPGCREIVREGVNGLLVPVRDAAALARALGRLVRDEEERRRMGTAGRALVLERFSVEHVIEQTLTVYRELLGETFAEGWSAGAPDRS
jgi:glycosyltransferase involved in cell wall biosynthesis